MIWNQSSHPIILIKEKANDSDFRKRIGQKTNLYCHTIQLKIYLYYNQTNTFKDG
jgi:hypothetical protein